MEEKKNNLIQEFLSFNLMLNSRKKIRTLRYKKKKKKFNLCCQKIKFWTKQKTINPPCKLNGQSLSKELVNTNVIVFGLVRPGFEPTMYYT